MQFKKSLNRNILDDVDGSTWSLDFEREISQN